MGENKVIDKYTLLSNSVYDYVMDKRIKIIDTVIYAAIKTQNDSGYGNSLSDIYRIFNIPYSSVKASADRLEECGLIEITYNNGKAVCIEAKLPNDDTDKIPKTILMSKDLDLRNKAFLLSIWIDVSDDGILDYTKKTLHEEVFKELRVGLAWVTSRITELSSFGILYVNGRSIQININKIISMSDNVVADVLKDSSDLEEIVVEYESKTGIDRDNIFDWKVSGEEPKKDFNSPKWLQPIVDALDEGCEKLSSTPFKLNSGELTNLGEHVKEIVEKNGAEPSEEVMQRIVDSILWKAEEVLRGNSDMKWWNKGYFTRKNKNNLSVNVFYFSEYLLKYPYAKKSVVKEAGKQVKIPLKKKGNMSTKKSGGNDFEMFDYGIDMN